MNLTSRFAKWTPYEVTAASLAYERRAEALQLEQLRIRLKKKMQEAEQQASAAKAA